jgi:hypothetical protein
LVDGQSEVFIEQVLRDNLLPTSIRSNAHFQNVIVGVFIPTSANSFLCSSDYIFTHLGCLALLDYNSKHSLPYTS